MSKIDELKKKLGLLALGRTGRGEYCSTVTFGEAIMALEELEESHEADIAELKESLKLYQGTDAQLTATQKELEELREKLVGYEDIEKRALAIMEDNISLKDKQLKPSDEKELANEMHSKQFIDLMAGHLTGKLTPATFIEKASEHICKHFGTDAMKDRLTEENIEKKITNYFILHKKFLRKNKSRTIIFGEDDSKRLAQSILKLIEV